MVKTMVNKKETKTEKTEKKSTSKKENKEKIKNILIPEQTKLTKEEGEKLLEKYNITIRQLPGIKKEDPGIRHLNPKVGDIIKIERKSQTAKIATYFRGVTK